MITQDQAFDYFDYSFDTGELFWQVKRQGRVKPGYRAGHLNKRTGYISICVDGILYQAHRIIWLMAHGEWPNQIDHINHIRHDNRIENLRDVSDLENKKNISLRADNTSGVCGVFWSGPHQKWRSRIMVERRTIDLGIYSDWFDAVCARKAAELRYEFHTNHGLPPSTK